GVGGVVCIVATSREAPRSALFSELGRARVERRRARQRSPADPGYYDRVPREADPPTPASGETSGHKRLDDRMATVSTPMSDVVTSGPAGIADPARRPGRRLTLVDRFVRVPLAFLWLVVLPLITFPVAIYMTLLYYLVRGARILIRRPSRRASESEGTEARVA